MRDGKNNIAFTPEAKQAIADVVAIHREGGFSYYHDIHVKVLAEFVKLTANSFGIIPAGYYQMQKPENQTAMTKARLAAIGAERIEKCQRFRDVVPNTSSWGLSLCDEGYAALAQLNLDKSIRPTCMYDIRDVLECVLGQGYDDQMMIDHNTEVKQRIKRSKYLKKVPAGDPLRAGLAEGQVCYEFTDAMFDDHIDVFSDVLFIGHQLRVVKDENGYYRIEKLCSDGWMYVTYEDKLYDVIVGLSRTLAHVEGVALQSAVQKAERGEAIRDELFTSDEVRQLAEAKGIELPQESTWSVVEDYSCPIACDKVREDAVVLASGLSYDDAKKLRALLSKSNEAKRDIRFANKRIQSLEKELEEKRAKLLELEAAAAQAEQDVINQKETALNNGGIIYNKTEAA